MSVQSQDTYLNSDTTLSVISGGGGPAVSSFSTFNVSSFTALNITAGYITSGLVSSVIGDFEDIGCSSISTLGIILDGNILTSVGSELLLNGVPIATASSLSTLADWSYDPAISTLNMNGNSTINGSLLSTLTINAGSGFITNLVCNDISTFTLTAQSTIHSISTISSLEIEAQVAVFSSINGAQFPAALVSSFETASVSSLTASTINGAQFPAALVSSFETASVSSLTASTINGAAFPGPVVDLSQWATLPAVSSIYSGSGATDDLKLVATRFLNANAKGVNFVVDEGANAAAPASFSVTAQNGNRGDISLTANPGIGGVFGQINLTANGGTTPALLATGGLISLTANTPVGTDPTLTSAIKLSAAGINSYAGAVPSIGSLLGYNFIYGTLGVNLCAGLPSVVPNTPGTTYIYGTNGVTIGSQLDTTSDIVQGAGGIYTTLLTGYWAGGLLLPQNLLIRGRQIPIIGNSYVVLSNVSTLSFDAGAAGAITGLQTINGSAYPPAAPAFPTALSCITLVASLSVSTPELFVSSINGVEYIPGGVSPDLIVSTLTAATSVSTQELFVSSINGVEYVPGGVSPDLVVSTLTAATSVSTQEIFVSSINGVEYVPGGVSPDLVVSTLTAATSVSTQELFVSSINGVEYIPGGVSPDLVVSTLTAATSVSTQEIFVSSINGVEYVPGGVSPDLVVSTLTAATSVSTQELYVSSINGVEYIPGGVSPDLIVSTLTAATSISTSQMSASSMSVNYLTVSGGLYAPGGVSTGDLFVDRITSTDFISASQLFVSSVNNAAYPPASAVPADLVVSTLTAATSVSTQELYVSSINGVEYVPGGVSPDLIVSTLTAATSVSTQELYVSSINGVEYVPGGVSPDLIVSTLTAATLVSTSELYVSSANVNTISCVTLTASGGIYAPGGVSTGDLYVARITSTDFISASQLFVSSAIGVSFSASQEVRTSTLTTSSITTNTADVNADLVTTRITIKSGQQNPGIHLPGQVSAPGISADIYFSQGLTGSSTIGLHLTSITPSSQALITEYYTGPFVSGGFGIGNFAMDTLFLSRSGTWANLRADAAGTSIESSVPISVSSLINISSINGAAYPPSASVSPDLVVSTLTAATSVSTQSLFISSINNALYPPPSSSSPNGEFSTMVVSSFINTLAVNTSSITANEMIVSSIQFGDATLSTCCFISNTGGTSADLQINLGVTGSTGPGTLRVYNNAQFGGGGIIDVQEIIGLSTISGRASADINLRPAAGRAVSIYNANTSDFGTLQVGNITQISTISGVDASFLYTATSTLSVSTINGAPVVSLPYTLSGTTAGATITNFPTGAGNPITQNVFNLITEITFNIPLDWSPTNSVYYDGWILSDFQANFNSFWGVSYLTNTFGTPTDLIGSTTTTANALNYSNIQQIYLTTNLIIPPTHLTTGGTITLRIYCNPTSSNHYLTITPVNQARIGLVKD